MDAIREILALPTVDARRKMTEIANSEDHGEFNWLGLYSASTTMSQSVSGEDRNLEAERTSLSLFILQVLEDLGVLSAAEATRHALNRHYLMLKRYGLESGLVSLNQLCALSLRELPLTLTEARTVIVDFETIAELAEDRGLLAKVWAARLRFTELETLKDKVQALETVESGLVAEWLEWRSESAKFVLANEGA